MAKNKEELLNIKNYPDKAHFYDDLSDRAGSDEDFSAGKLVWDSIAHVVGPANMSLYHLHRWYLLSDVAMLADLWAWLCETITNTMEVHPANFLTGNGMAFKAALQLGRTNIDLLSDHQQNLLF